MDKLMIECAAKAIWDWEHEGRNNQILAIEWSLQKDEYYEMARVAIEAVKSYKHSPKDAEGIYVDKCPNGCPLCQTKHSDDVVGEMLRSVAPEYNVKIDPVTHDTVREISSKKSVRGLCMACGKETLNLATHACNGMTIIPAKTSGEK